jgi:hypothetical protein
MFLGLNIVLQGELAVHVKKVEDVRRWLSEAFDGGYAGKLQKYRVSPSYIFLPSCFLIS